MHADLPLLSVLIWLPIVAGVMLLVIGDRSPAFGRWLALGCIGGDVRREPAAVA